MIINISVITSIIYKIITMELYIATLVNFMPGGAVELYVVALIEYRKENYRFST